ncbi:Gfo/Idh/MocA family oxidoreductase [Ferrimicrobium sp.]|uniref:Gfo/Idh/MocA family protein n=1 Tax=Ferrimicrobium sp. TaxID=2926050 RepID=UPI002610F96B|nr:Gfo/Idh/MocA family oxidoreductase [Ferrimicrobium sp.]
MMVPANQRSTIALLERASWRKGVQVLDSPDALSFGQPAVLVEPETLTPSALRAIQEGASVFVLINQLHGAKLLQSLPNYRHQKAAPWGEWMVTPNHAFSPLTRTPDEFSVRTAITTFTPPDDATTLLTVNIALSDHVVASQQTLGKGQLTIIGLDLEALAGSHSWLERTMELLIATPPSRKHDTLGIGVIGYGPYGGMGLYHGTGAQETPGLQLVTAVDANPARLTQAQQDFPNLIGYRSAAEMFRDSITDIAIIATPPNTHFDLALQALEGGKHVVVEKPLCLTTDEADKLIDVAESNERVLTVHQNRRWDQDYRTLVDLLDRGVIGDVFNIETSVGGFDHPCRAWHSDATVSGGLAYDWGAHHIDWIHQLYGTAPERIFAFGHKSRWHEMTNLDQLRIHLQFTGGREATFFQSELDGFRRPKFYVQGTEGTIVGNYMPFEQPRVAPVTGYQVDRYHYAEAPVALQVALYEGPGRLSHYHPALLPPDTFGFHRDLADHLLVGTPLAVQPGQVREVVGVLELAHRSSALGSIQTLTPR